jgi:hypothetical protein
VVVISSAGCGIQVLEEQDRTREAAAKGSKSYQKAGLESGLGWAAW